MTRRSAFTDQQAPQILAVLISEKKISEHDARLALARYRKRIDQLRRELRILEGGDAPFPRQRRMERAVGRVRRSKPISAKRPEGDAAAGRLSRRYSASETTGSSQGEDHPDREGFRGSDIGGSSAREIVRKELVSLPS
jgi:hypothetical protein